MSGMTSVRKYVKKGAAGTVLRLVLILSFVLPSFRGFGLSRAAAQQTGADEASFSLAYVPRDALFVLALRPEALLQRPAISPFGEAIHEMVVDSFQSPVPPADIVELSLFALPSNRSGITVAMKIRTSSPDAADLLIETFGTESNDTSFAGFTYRKATNSASVCRLDDTTILVARDESTMRRCLVAGEEGAANAKWADRWAAIAKAEGAAIANTSLTRGYPHQMTSGLIGVLVQERNLREQANMMGFKFSPLWSMSDTLSAQLNVSDEIELRVVAESRTVEEANEVHTAILAAIAFGRIALSLAREGAVASDDGGSIIVRQINFFDRALEDAIVARRDTQVGMRIGMDEQTTKAVAAMAIPVANAARSARSAQQSSSNLKRIGLAFHNYHDTYRCFPVATQIGPKEVPRSWRVTILPFLGQHELYKEYRQDEPWDSEHNAKLLAKIPDAYRCPMDRRDSTNTSYFLLDGPEAALGNRNNRPSSMAQITDGTSNTLLAVESKLAIPWTKPGDIPFDPEQPIPDIGGWYPTGFNVGFCDGSTRMLPYDLDEQTLQHVIMRSDGHPIRLPPP